MLVHTVCAHASTGVEEEKMIQKTGWQMSRGEHDVCVKTGALRKMQKVGWSSVPVEISQPLHFTSASAGKAL